MGGSWTALHFAAEKGRHDAIALLVKHGADPTARNARGQTPLDEAALYGQPAQAASVAAAMARTTERSAAAVADEKALMNAAREGALGDVQRLVEAGTGRNCANGFGYGRDVDAVDATPVCRARTRRTRARDACRDVQRDAVVRLRCKPKGCGRMPTRCVLSVGRGNPARALGVLGDLIRTEPSRGSPSGEASFAAARRR
jgi:hypothetical protein